MTCIALETIRRKTNTFELVQTWYTGFNITGEKSIEWIDADNDRLKAAIINLGFACRDLFEVRHIEVIRMISVESDKDGLDHRYKSEHDILYALLFPHSDFEARKLNSLYSEYHKYLVRIKQLRDQAKIEIRMHKLRAAHPYATY